MAKKIEIPNDIEGLQKLVLQLLERVGQLETENAELKAENKELKRQLPLPIQGLKGRPKKSKGRCLYDRLKKYQDGVLAFAFEDHIPFYQ